ncbi:MAG: thermonuclease family protein [Thermoleophilaceae bacterium]
MAVGAAADGVGGGGDLALHLGPPRDRQLGGCKASPGGVIGPRLGPPSLRACFLARLAFRRLLAGPLVLLCFIGCGGPGGGGHLATVTRVVDGDTVWLSGLGRVRLIGVDTPEVYGSVECFGPAASAYTKRVLRPGVRVRYRMGVEGRDRYGRALAYVWLRDGRLFNELLVARGYARPLTIPPNDRYAARFAADAERARAAGRGLWRACG